MQIQPSTTFLDSKVRVWIWNSNTRNLELNCFEVERRPLFLVINSYRIFNMQPNMHKMFNIRAIINIIMQFFSYHWSRDTGMHIECSKTFLGAQWRSPGEWEGAGSNPNHDMKFYLFTLLIQCKLVGDLFSLNRTSLINLNFIIPSTIIHFCKCIGTYSYLCTYNFLRV